MTSFLRPARFSEVPALYAMAEPAFAASFPVTNERAAVEAMLGGLVFSPDGYLRVVEADGQVAALLAGMASTIDPWARARIAMERIVYVHPEHRGKAAFLLLRDFIAWARDQHCEAVFASSQYALEGERFGKLLERLGFTAFEMNYVMRLP